MINNFNFKNPIVLSLITFVIITIFQIYKNYYKNKLDDDDYDKPSIVKLMKAPIIASIITWLAANYLIGSINTEKKEITNNSIYLEPSIEMVNIRNDNFSVETLENNIFLDQPDF